jgi:hypothetical protein
MVLQLLRSSDVKVTVVRIGYDGNGTKSSVASPPEAHTTPSKDVTPSEVIDTTQESTGLAALVAKTVRFPHRETASTSVQSTNDHDLEEETYFTNIIDSVPADIKDRLDIENVITPTPLQYAVKRANKEINSHNTNYHLVVVGRGTRFTRSGDLSAVFRRDLRHLVKDGHSVEMVGKSCLGDAGEAMLLGNVLGGLLVIQSGNDEE